MSDLSQNSFENSIKTPLGYTLLVIHTGKIKNGIKRHWLTELFISTRSLFLGNAAHAFSFVCFFYTAMKWLNKYNWNVRKCSNVPTPFHKINSKVFLGIKSPISQWIYVVLLNCLGFIYRKFGRMCVCYFIHPSIHYCVIALHAHLHSTSLCIVKYNITVHRLNDDTFSVS